MSDSTPPNFAVLYPKYPFTIKVLENDRIKLVPFEYEHHAEALYAGIKGHPEFMIHFTQGPFPDVESIQTSLLDWVRVRPAMLYAVMVKTQPHTEEFAGASGIRTARECISWPKSPS